MTKENSDNKEAIKDYLGFHDQKEFWRTVRDYLRSKGTSKKYVRSSN